MQSLMDVTADLQAGQTQGTFGWNRHGHFFVRFFAGRDGPPQCRASKNELSWICCHHTKYKKSTSQNALATNVTRTADENYRFLHHRLDKILVTKGSVVTKTTTSNILVNYLLTKG